MHANRHKAATIAAPHSTAPAAPAKVAVVAAEKNPATQAIDPEVIRFRAYCKWESAGMPTDDGVAFWLEAENELARGK